MYNIFADVRLGELMNETQLELIIIVKKLNERYYR